MHTITVLGPLSQTHRRKMITAIGLWPADALPTHVITVLIVQAKAGCLESLALVKTNKGVGAISEHCKWQNLCSVLTLPSHKLALST